MALNVELTSHADDVLSEMQSALERALEAVGLQAENYVKMELEKPKPHANGENRPNVDTGRLVNSISHRVVNGEKAVYVGTNVEYAA